MRPNCNQCPQPPQFLQEQEARLAYTYMLKTYAKNCCALLKSSGQFFYCFFLVLSLQCAHHLQQLGQKNLAAVSLTSTGSLHRVGSMPTNERIIPKEALWCAWNRHLHVIVAFLVWEQNNCGKELFALATGLKRSSACTRADMLLQTGVL